LTFRRPRRDSPPFRVDTPCALLVVALAIAAITPVTAHGDLHEQIAAATRAIGVRPHDAALYLTRGELYRAHHETAPALADYGRALRIDPTLDAARLARGRLLVEARRASNALPDLNRFLGARPDHAEARLVRARALAALGDTAAAREDYDEALRLAANPDWYIERAHLVRRSAGAASALDGLDEGLARLGPIVTLTLEAIDCEMSLGHHDAALARVDRLVAASGAHPQWMLRRGDILIAAGRRTEARAAFAETLAGIDSLPPARQHTRQMEALRAQAASALLKLETAPRQP
jgi:predicted Zn-dependent protease